MKSKTIFIAIGVIGIGVILYKLLLGLVLPIALFVSLGYVLKFLLKGSESDSEQEVSQILTNSDTSTSKENIVEIQLINDKPSEDDKPSKYDKLSEGGQFFNDNKSTEEDKSF